MPVKSIRIDDVLFDVNFRHSNRAKYLSIKLDSSKNIEVVLPHGYKFERAESFLYQKSDWIKKHLKKLPSVSFSYFGQKVEIEQTYDLFIKKHKLKFEKNKLQIVSPQGSRDKINTLFEAWLKIKAKQYLPVRAAELAELHSFKFKSVRIKGQKTRWGSCSSKKNISFNYRLMKYRNEVIDYVIIHELCHLKEMNHSERFWKMVENICPGYKLLKKELKHQ